MYIGITMTTITTTISRAWAAHYITITLLLYYYYYITTTIICMVMQLLAMNTVSNM